MKREMMGLGVAGLVAILPFVSFARSRTIDAFRTSEVREDIVMADGDELVVAGTNADVVIRGRVMGPKATVCGRLGRPGSCSQKATFLAPLDVETVRWGMDYGEGAMELRASGSHWRRFELAYARVFCRAANVLAPEGVLTWGAYYRGDLDRCATFDLGGFDQTIDRLESTSSPGGKNSDHVFSSGGTLTLRGTANAVCRARLDGGFSLVWNPRGDFEQAFDERENGLCGALLVKRGTVRIGPHGTFRNLREIKVWPGAALVCEAVATGALASVTTVELLRGARLKVTGADPFVPEKTTVVCHAGATVESAVRLALKAKLTADDTPPRNIGEKLQVFWDDFVVDAALTTATRMPHQPEYAGVAYRCSQPWEGDGGSYSSVVRDGDGWIMYRQTMRVNETSPRYTGILFGILQSKDGVTWTRRNVNKYVVCGEKMNNVVTDPDVNFWDNFMVFKDTNPDCPPAERYKAISFFGREKYDAEFVKRHPDYAEVAKSGKALWCLFSEDGSVFRPGRKLFSFGDFGLRFDSLNVVFWDDVRKVYRLYMRSIKPVKYDRYGGTNARWVKCATSKDFKTWTSPVDIAMNGDREEYELYTNNMVPYPRNPELIVGFPTRYTDRKRWMSNYNRLCGMEKRRERMGNDPRHGLAITDALFMWSRDGRTFSQEEDAFLSPGPECARNWVYGSCYLSRGFVESPGRYGEDPEYSFYALDGEWMGGPGVVHRYALRLDGFVSYHGRYRTDKLVTRRVIFSGDQLLVNFKTSARGRLFVTVRDETGNQLKTDEVFGDKVDRVVDFEGGSLADFAGKPVTIEFELSDADLYSFRFCRAPETPARAIESAPLARRAESCAARLFACGMTNASDEVRIPWLGALNMQYRATGDMAVLASAQRLFALMRDTKRPHAAKWTQKTELFDLWLAVADSHFAIAKDPWPVRWTFAVREPETPRLAAFKVKYLNDIAARTRIAKLGAAAPVLPADGERLADGLAYAAIGACSRADVVSKLQAATPSDERSCAEWLWAYWTARQVED